MITKKKIIKRGIKIIGLLMLIAIGQFAFGQTEFNYSKDFKTILEKTKDPNSDVFYDKLLKRFISNDSTLTRPEILSLMIGFTDKPEYKPYAILPTERLLYQLNDENKFKEAHDTAILLLRSYPLSYQGLKEMSYTMSKLDKKDSADYYIELLAKIMHGMLYSGDFKNSENAMFSLGPADGESMISGAGYHIGKLGSGYNKSGYFLDMFEATKDGNSVKMYFNIQHAVEKMFSPEDKKKMDDALKEMEKTDKKGKKKKK